LSQGSKIKSGKKEERKEKNLIVGHFCLTHNCWLVVLDGDQLSDREIYILFGWNHRQRR